MLDSEWATDIGIMVGTIVTIVFCCAGTLLSACYYSQRRTRPREDSDESLV